MIINEISISENIKRYRKLSGLTQKQLASMTDSNVKYIGELEQSRGKLPSIEMLYKIADALKIAPDMLIYENLKCNQNNNTDISSTRLNKNIAGFSESKLHFVLDVINSVSQ